MDSRHTLTLAVALSLLTLATPASAQDKVTYQDHVLPVFRNACLNCHNPEKKKAGLDLSSYAGTMAGSENGKVIEPGDPDGSLLFRLVQRTEEPFMPPKGDKLPDKDLEAIKKWIAGGVLENAGSSAVASNKPKVDLKVAATTTGKPDGPPPMPGTLVLEPTVRPQRAGQLLCLAASPWAPLAALGSPHQVLLYNTDSLELLGVLPFPEGLPHTIKFSRSGKLLLVGGGVDAKSGKVVLFDVATGNRVTELGDEFDAVLAADISPDQTHVVLGGPGKVVKMLSTASGATVKSIKKHTDWVTALAYSPDGVLFASGDRNGGLFVWEAGSGGMFYTLNGHKSAITSLCYRGDSNVLASASEDGSVKLWDMAGGNEVKSWNPHGGQGVLSVNFTHDGRMVTSGRDRMVRTWKPDGAGIRQLEPAFDDIALHAAFDHDGKRAVGGDWTGKVRVWNAEDSKVMGELAPNPPTLAERLATLEKRIAELQPARDKAAGEYAPVAEAAAKAKAEAEAAAQQLATAQKAAAAAQAVLTAATAARDAAAAEQAKLAAAAAAKQKAAEAAAQAVAATNGAAQAQPGDAMLTKLAADTKSAADRLASEVAPAQKAAADAAAQLKSLGDAAVKAQAELAAPAAALPAMVEAARTKADAAKAAADSAAKLKAPADAAEAQLTLARHDQGRLRAAQVFATLDGARRELAARQAEQQNAPAVIQSARQAAEKAKADIAAFEKRTAEAPQRVAAAEQAAKQAQEALGKANEATAAPARLQAQREALVQQSSDLARELARALEKQKDNANLKQALDQSKAAAAALEKELIAARTAAGAAASAAEAAKAALAAAQSAVAKEKTELANAPKSLEALKKKATDAEAEIPKAEAFAQAAPGKTAAAQQKVDQLTGDYDKLVKQIPPAPQPTQTAAAPPAPPAKG